MNIRNLIPFKTSILSASINKFLGVALILLVLLTSSVASAQVFPVQVSPQLTPPYSLKLSDYSTTTAEKLLVNLLLTDVNESDLQVRLRFSISGNSVRIQSKDFVQNAAPIQLTGGIPLRLSNLDLQPYFDLQNLDGITPSEYSKPLPDGLYQFCFEVFDWTTGRPLSEKKCFPVYLVLNDPPFLNLPQNGEQVPARDPQNLIFQWTPRHVNATGVEYEFELRELWDTQVDPQTAFLASPNLYQTTGFANTLLYGPGETSLLEGKTYGWRVRAVVSDGISETAVFKNGGYSEIFYFTYTGKCDAPQYILAKSEGTTTEEITWQQNPDHINYQIQFRKEGGSNNVWFESETVETKKKLFFLEAETTYEYRVGGQCVQNGGYSYSAVNTFTTPGKEDASEYNCGIPPEIVITNQDPLQQLGVNDVFTAGDFPVTVKEVNGGNGNYTGWGFIVVPYLGDTQIRVSFNNIQINTDKQLTTGLVETEYDEKFATTGGAGMSDVSELTELIEGDNDIDNINVNFVIPPDYFEDYITVEDGQVVITNPNDAQVRTSPLGDDKVIVDSAGNTYHVDAEGNVTKGGKIDEGGPVNADNVEGVTKNGDIESLTAKGITVTFNTKGTYGYDKLPTGINNTKLNEEYKTIKDAQGGNYEIVNHVAEKNVPSLITATVAISNSDYNIDDLIFKTKQGELLTHTKATNNTINLSVQGRYTFENEPIYAVVKSKQDTTKQQTAGAFNLWHLSRKTVDVVLVSVDGAQLPTALELNTIFNQAATTLNIETKSVSLTNGLLGADNKLEIGDKPWLNTYNQEQKAIIADLKQKIDYQKDKYYVFTFNSNFITTKSIAGFMPLKRQFGFVFNGGLDATEEGKEDLAKVTAHEVAHGIFALQHPFTTYGDDIKGKTLWLMDYANGDLLSHMDWAQIHNPNLKFYIFQDEEDGESATFYNLELLKPFANLDGTYTFISMAGKPITLPSNITRIEFSTGDDVNLENCQDNFSIIPFGALKSFSIEDDKYRFCAVCNSNEFTGYYKSYSEGNCSGLFTENRSKEGNVKAITGLPCLSGGQTTFQFIRLNNYFKNYNYSSLKDNSGAGKRLPYNHIIDYLSYEELNNNDKINMIAEFKPNYDTDIINYLTSLKICDCGDTNLNKRAYAFTYATQLQKNKQYLECFESGIPLFFFNDNTDPNADLSYVYFSDWQSSNINGFSTLKSHIEKFKHLSEHFPNWNGVSDYLTKFVPEEFAPEVINEMLNSISLAPTSNDEYLDDTICLWKSINLIDRLDLIHYFADNNGISDRTEEILLNLIIYSGYDAEFIIDELKGFNNDFSLLKKVWNVLDGNEKSVFVNYIAKWLLTNEFKNSGQLVYDTYNNECVNSFRNEPCDLNLYKVLPLFRANFFDIDSFNIDIGPGGSSYEVDYYLETKFNDLNKINIQVKSNAINFSNIEDYWDYFSGAKEIFNQEINPFQPIVLEVMEDIQVGSTSLKKGQVLTVPAIFLHWFDSTVDLEQNLIALKVIADIAAIYLAPFTAGGSTILASIEIGMASTDIAITLLNETSDNVNPEMIETWNAIYGLYNIMFLPKALVSAGELTANGTKTLFTFVKSATKASKIKKILINKNFLNSFLTDFRALSSTKRLAQITKMDNLILALKNLKGVNSILTRDLYRVLIEVRMKSFNVHLQSSTRYIELFVESSSTAFQPYLAVKDGNTLLSLAKIELTSNKTIKFLSDIRWLPSNITTTTAIARLDDIEVIKNNLTEIKFLEIVEDISNPGQFYIKPITDVLNTNPLYKTVKVSPNNSNLYPEGFRDIAINEIVPMHGPRRNTNPNGVSDVIKVLNTEGFKVLEPTLINPVRVVELPDGTKIIMDGHHRVLGMKTLEETNVPVLYTTYDKIVENISRGGSIEPISNLYYVLTIGKKTGNYEGDWLPEHTSLTNAKKQELINAAEEFIRTDFPEFATGLSQEDFDILLNNVQAKLGDNIEFDSWYDNIGEDLLTKLDNLSADKIENLGKHLKESSKLAIEIKKNPSLVDSWDLIITAIGQNTKFATDNATLAKVSTMLKEGSILRQRYPDNYEQVLKEILKAAENSPCTTCPEASGLTKAFPSMEKHLDNVNYFIENFEINGTADKFFNWMRGKAKNGSNLSENSTLKSEMAQTLSELKTRGFKEADVELGARFKPTSSTSKMSDIRNSNLDIELKNKDFPNANTADGKLSKQEIEQVFGAEGAFSVKTKLSDYEWKVNPLRKNANENNLKELWKKAFQNTNASKGLTKTQIFNNMNDELKQSLNLTGLNAQSKFTELIGDVNSNLYSFIKSE